MIYPIVYFDPGNFLYPIQTTYKDYFQQLSANLFKKNRYFFSETESVSDKGLIFPSLDKYSLLTLDYFETDLDYKSVDDLKDPKMSSSIFATTIYLSKNHNRYSLNYMKLQDLAAQVGGFMKIVMVFFFIINYQPNKFYRDIDVFNKLFDFEEVIEDPNQNLSKLDEKRSSIYHILSRDKTCKLKM